MFLALKLFRLGKIFLIKQSFYLVLFSLSAFSLLASPSVWIYLSSIYPSIHLIMLYITAGENELLNLVHEVEEKKEQESSLHNLQLSPLLWRYRPRITVDHFFRQFHLLIEREKELKDKLKVLNLFSSEVHSLVRKHLNVIMNSDFSTSYQSLDH